MTLKSMNSQSIFDNTMERPFVISDRVGYLDRTRKSDTFVLSTWSPTEYGDDETTYRDYFDDKLDGYKHALIKIEDMDTTALGLVPQNSNDKHFVEIDYFNFPIECTEKGLDAVMITEGILSGESNNYDDSIKNIVKNTSRDEISLKFAIFQRLSDYFHDNAPSKLYELLPWEFLDEYLEYMIHLISKFTDKTYDKTSETTSGDLPDLMFYFSSLSRTISYNLLSLVEEMEKFGDGKSVDISIIDKVNIINKVYSFIDDLYSIDTNKLLWINNNIKHRWNKTIDRLCNSYLVKMFNHSFKSNSVKEYILSIFKGNLLISKFKKIDNSLDLNHLGSVYRGVLESDKFDMFETRRNYSSLIYDKLKETEQKIHIEDLDIIVEKEKDIRAKFDAWMNAADICRFYAQYLLFVKVKPSRRENAKRALNILENKAEPLYDKAGYHLEPLLKLDKNRFYYQRLIRMYILKAKIYKQMKEKDISIKVTKKAMDILDTLRSLEQDRYKEEEKKDDYRGLYPYLIMRCNILSFMVELGIDKKGIYSKELIDILDKLITSKPEEYTAYNMKYKYYLNVEKNYKKAIEAMDEWVAKGDNTKYKKHTVEYLQYRIVTDLVNLYYEEKAYRDDNELFKEIVTKYMDIMKTQYNNLLATEEFVSFLQSNKDNLSKEIMNLIDEGLKPITDKDMPITHFILRSIFLPDSISRDLSIDNNITDLKGIEKICKRRLTEGQLNKHILFAIEIFSKHFFTLGKENNDELLLKTSDHLISLYRNAYTYEEDIIFITRQMEIAAISKDYGKLDYLYEEAKNINPDDTTVLLIYAKSLIKRSKITLPELEEARNIITKGAKNDEAEDQLHPAIRDCLVDIYTKQGNIPKALKRCESLIAENERDPISWFRMARIKYRQGERAESLKCYIETMRLRLSDRKVNEGLLLMTSCTIANLFCSKDYYEELLNVLKGEIASEDEILLSLLMKGFGITGQVDTKIIDIFKAANKDNNIIVARSIAQLLTARTIYLLSSNVTGDVDKEIKDCIEWSQTGDITAEYLAGAKHIYARAVLNSNNNAAFLTDKGSIDAYFISVDTNSRALSEYISQTGKGVLDYYKTAYGLFGKLPDKSIDFLVEFAKHLFKRILNKSYDEKNNYNDLKVYPYQSLQDFNNKIKPIDVYTDPVALKHLLETNEPVSCETGINAVSGLLKERIPTDIQSFYQRAGIKISKNGKVEFSTSLEYDMNEEHIEEEEHDRRQEQLANA